MTTMMMNQSESGSSPRGISWNNPPRPPRSGGSGSGGRHRSGPGRRKLPPNQLLYQNQNNNKNRPRDEVLDSSSDEEEETKGEIMTTKAPSAFHNVVDDDDDGNHDDEDDDVDQFMNPYVMKPHFQLFNSSNSNVSNLQPFLPSMEMTSVQSGREFIPSMTEKSTNKTSSMRKSSDLFDFDPFSPNRNERSQQQHMQYHFPNCDLEIESEPDESTIHFTSSIGQPQKQLSSFESNDQFDNLFIHSPSSNSPPKQSRPNYHVDQHDVVRSGNPSFSASFSPIPKCDALKFGESAPLVGSGSSPSESGASISHHYPYRGPTLGGRSPLLAVASPSNSINGQWKNRFPTVISGASAAIQSALYYASRTASIFLNGRDRDCNKKSSNFSNINPQKPLLSSFPEKFRHGNHYRYSSWRTITSIRVLLLVMTALFGMRTMSIMIWTLPNSMDISRSAIAPNEGITTEHQQYLQENERHQIIVNKMKKAKAHWWSRKKVDASSGSSSSISNNAQQQDEKLDAFPHSEIYRNGNKEDGEMKVPEQIFLSESIIEANASSASAIIVETEEDGTILIKLPPPKLSLEEPKLGSEKKTDLDEEDETMYIKLPYSRYQEPKELDGGAAFGNDSIHKIVSITKREIEPPPRGAAPQEPRQTQSSILIHHPPPPLSHHDHHHGGKYRHLHEHDHPGVLHALRKEFESWMSKHGKQYVSKKEEDHRFNVWRTNHARIAEKNEFHGPCRMTGKAVFGHNLFSDLDPEEFQSKFLTGYRGPRHHDPLISASTEKVLRRKDGGGRDAPSYFREVKRVAESPSSPPRESLIKRHPSIQRKLDEIVAKYGAGGFDEITDRSRLHGTKFQSNYGSSCNWWDMSCYRRNGVKFPNGCAWWDVSCVLRYIFGYPYIGGTREPVYDESSYPSVLDWRTLGVVTGVNSQGACGACWAITAVETIESAHAIASGQLIDLDEEEVIACDGTCEMCNGGWPQNAYEYVMKHGGLPAKTSDYNADWLYLITAVLAGESYDVSEDQLGSYFAQTCPAGQREGESGEARQSDGGKSHHSDDSDNQQYASSYVASTRYGKVKGYGYATDRCVCYTDGSGCDCDNQDERTAVLNVASYGPAAVCLEASLWQNYEGGIMTSDIGCSSGFLDMNHCVEVVGYAFIDGTRNSSSNGGVEGDANHEGNKDEKSHKSGSRDNATREGYWIVKNQWSSYWGMGGYAYVAMGSNTCGILNDMTQVYMK